MEVTQTRRGQTVEMVALVAALIVDMGILEVREMAVHLHRQVLVALHHTEMLAGLIRHLRKQSQRVLAGVEQVRPETQIDSLELVETIEVVTAVTEFTFLPLLLMAIVVTLEEAVEAVEVIHPALDKVAQAVKAVEV